MMEAEVMSEISPINGLPKGWRWEPLSDVADNLDNKRKPINAAERETRPGDVPYYGATGQVGWIDKHLLDEEVVLVGEDGAPFLEPGRAKAYMVSGKSWVNNHAHVLRAKDGMPNAYLMHFLNILDYAPYVSGTTRLKLTKGAMGKIPIPVAPLPEQRRIVSAIETQLGRLDAAVARLHAAKAKLKRYKQAVLKAAYDEVAETHEVKTFGELKEFSMYGPRFSSDDYTNDGVPVLRTSDIDDLGHVNMSTAPKLNLSKEQIAKYKLKLGDLLVTRTGSIGTVSVFNDSVDAIAGAFLIQYRLGGVDPWYAFYFLRGPVAQHHLIGNIAGIGRPNLNVAAIDSLELPVPPMKVQVAIRKTIEVKLNRVAELDATLDAQLLQGTRLRQAVLKRAFEGRLV